MSEKKRKGPAKVYLVGAGPGAPAFMTLRAVELLGLCDVLLYDRLIDKSCLQYAKRARLIPVGKEAGKGSKDKQQEDIIHLLIRYSREGLRTARLKGGDPFIFGRGGEELLALAEAEIPFEVAPGVSSFSAAPGIFGIPLTHRSISNSFSVFTAHSRKQGKEEAESEIDWEIAVRSPTAVFLMGLGNLALIVKNLREHGRKPETPIALLSRAGFPDQDIVLGTLKNIEERERAKDLKGPVTIVVGETLHIHDKIKAFLSPIERKSSIRQ